jgi:hypothetical protein
VARGGAFARLSVAEPVAGGVRVVNRDGESIDSIVRAIYEGVSGPAGREWDRARERALYYPGARLLRVVVGDDELPRAQAMSVEEFMDDTADYFRAESFYEVEIARRTDRFGNIAHVFSTYEASHEPDGAPFKRGINSLQLFWDGARWWVTAAQWDNETDRYPLPAKYLASEAAAED